jgi:hypothetical protein
VVKGVEAQNDISEVVRNRAGEPQDWGYIKDNGEERLNYLSYISVPGARKTKHQSDPGKVERHQHQAWQSKQHGPMRNLPKKEENDRYDEKIVTEHYGVFPHHPQ